MQLLIEHGASTNTKARSFGTAINLAALSGDKALTKLLLDNGADINAHGGYFGSVVRATRYSNKAEGMSRLLLNCGAIDSGNEGAGAVATNPNGAKSQGND